MSIATLRNSLIADIEKILRQRIPEMARAAAEVALEEMITSMRKERLLEEQQGSSVAAAEAPPPVPPAKVEVPPPPVRSKAKKQRGGWNRGLSRKLQHANTETKRKGVLDALTNAGKSGATRAELSKALGITVNKQMLQQLRTAGKVKLVGKGRGIRWVAV